MKNKNLEKMNGNLVIVGGESQEKEDIMADKKIKIKLENPYPEEGFGFEKMFSNDKVPQIELTTPFDVEGYFRFEKMFSNIKIIEIEECF